MEFILGKSFLDAIILSIVAKDQQGSYGHEIGKYIKERLDMSESTVYAVLKRLHKNGYLENHPKLHDGRNRNYYKITEAGIKKLNLYQTEWHNYSQKINSLLSIEISASDD